MAAERERANLPSSGISIAGFLVQLRVFGYTDTAETDSQTDRQTDRPLGRQERQTSEVREGDVFGEDVVLISARVAVCLPYDDHPPRPPHVSKG